MSGSVVSIKDYFLTETHSRESLKTQKTLLYWSEVLRTLSERREGMRLIKKLFLDMPLMTENLDLVCSLSLRKGSHAGWPKNLVRDIERSGCGRKEKRFCYYQLQSLPQDLLVFRLLFMFLKELKLSLQVSAGKKSKHAYQRETMNTKKIKMSE